MAALGLPLFGIHIWWCCLGESTTASRHSAPLRRQGQAGFGQKAGMFGRPALGTVEGGGGHAGGEVGGAVSGPLALCACRVALVAWPLSRGLAAWPCRDATGAGRGCHGGPWGHCRMLSGAQSGARGGAVDNDAECPLPCALCGRGPGTGPPAAGPFGAVPRHHPGRLFVHQAAAAGGVRRVLTAQAASHTSNPDAGVAQW